MISNDPMLPESFHIRQKRSENHDTFTLELEPVNENSRFSFAPGQFNMLYSFGIGEVAISISGNPDKPMPVLHTIRAVGTVTKALRQLKPGDMVGLRGPFGTSWPVDKAKGRDLLIITGGIGLAPLRPVLYYILAHRSDYGKVALLYGARTPKDQIYRREIERWRGRFDLQIGVTVDYATKDWRGDVGVVTTLIPRAQFNPANTVAMICGPEVMMRFAIMDLERHGVEMNNIFISMERNMKCAVGFCGHCQLGPAFICKDGPVFRYPEIAPFFGKREI
ncbi:MAG: FAD/NAD(P)-binding protein [Acidobacteriota bacterium]